MKGLYYQLKLNYKGTNIGIKGLTYRIRYQSLVFPTTGGLLLKNKITKEGLTEKFYVKQNEFIIFVEVKGGKTQYQEYTNLIKNKLEGIKVNTEAVKVGVLNDNVPYVIPVELPINPPFSAVAQENSSKVDSDKHKAKYHQVIVGDSISTIAKKYNITTQELMGKNNIKDDSDLKKGMKIYIGEGNFKKNKFEVINNGSVVIHKVKKNETLISIAKDYKTQPAKIALLNGISLNKLDFIRAGEQLIVDWAGQENRVQQALLGDVNKTLLLASYKKNNPLSFVENNNKVKIYGLSLGGNLVSIMGYGFDIGIAIDQFGDWMLFIAPALTASFNPRDVNLHGKNNDEAWKLIEKNKDKLSKDVKITFKGIKQNIDVKFLSDLKGHGFSKSHTLSVGPYNGAVTETWAQPESGREIQGQQFEFGYEIGGKKIKQAAKEGRIVNYEESRAKSYTFSIISDETNEISTKIFIADKAIEGNK